MFSRYFEPFPSKNVSLNSGGPHQATQSNHTRVDDGVRHESRIIRWRRESANGNANLIIGGGMLFMVFTVVTIVFYCSHHSMRKRSTATRQRRWMDSDASLEVYTVDQFFDQPATGASAEATTDTPPLLTPPVHGQPPPPYEAVIADHYAGGCSPAAQHMLRFPHHFHRFSDCHCRQHVTTAHQNYDLVKKCRQCRRQIKDESDDSCDDGDGREFCQCLLQSADGDDASGMLSPAQLRAAQRILQMQPTTLSLKEGLYDRLSNNNADSVFLQINNNIALERETENITNIATNDENTGEEALICEMTDSNGISAEPFSAAAAVLMSPQSK